MRPRIGSRYHHAVTTEHGEDGPNAATGRQDRIAQPAGRSAAYLERYFE
jgi:hypothetical protein